MNNPINTRVRGTLYLISIVVGTCAVIVAPLSAALNWSDEWTQVALVAVGVITAVTATLARANLPSPDVPAEPPERALAE